jgi:hypothetical protein
MSPIVRVLAFFALAATSERVMVGRRTTLGANKVPPVYAFVLAEPSVRARGEDLPKTRPKEGQILRCEASDRLEHQENVAQQNASIARRQRKDRRRDEHGLRVLGESDSGCGGEMVRRGASIEGRNPAHGVDDMLVETREEPKPVFARQSVLDGARGAAGELMAACVFAVVDDGNTAGLSSS